MVMKVVNVRDAFEFNPEKMKKVSLFNTDNFFCDIYCLEPGQSQSEHTHDDSDKIYHGLAGKCRVRIGDESRLLEPGQVAVAPAGVVHGVHNETDQRAALLVIMAPHPDFT